MRSRPALPALLTAAAFLFSIFLPACERTPEGELPDLGGGGSAVTPSVSEIEAPETAVSGGETIAADCTVVLADEGIAVTGKGASAQGGVLTVNSPGRYLLRGSLTAGQITVDVREKEDVLLVLDGVSVTSPAGSALRVLSAPKKVTVYLPEGSVNLLSGSADESVESGAALDSKEDLVFDGGGSLYVTATGFKGVVSKDDLTVKGGNLFITATDDGLRGKDSVTVEGGSIQIEAGGDGIHAENDEDASLGNLRISGGRISVIAAEDGVQAGGSLTVEGGTVDLLTGGGSAANTTQKEDDFGGGHFSGGRPGGDFGGRPGPRPGGDRRDTAPSDGEPDETNKTENPVSLPAAAPPDGMTPPDDTTLPDRTGSTTEDVSRKGMKAEGTFMVTGGSITVDAYDDALHTNGDFTMTGGSLALSSGDDGVHADGGLSVCGGSLTVTASYEGLEGKDILLSEGDVTVTATDDGVNATDGSGSQMGGMGGFGGRGPGGFGGSADCSLTITGGSLLVNAEGDGLDSGGDITQTGGTVIVFGPTRDGNGALDVGDGGNSYKISGGILLAVGAEGMAESATGDGQAVIAGRIGQVSADTLLSLRDGEGNTLLAAVLPKGCAHIVFSCPALAPGESYEIYTGGEVDGTAEGGYLPGAVVTGGERLTALVAS